MEVYYIYRKTSSNVYEKVTHNKELVFKHYRERINKADVIFAYIDSMDCYTTIAQIGYAYHSNKDIFIVVDEGKLTQEQIDKLWFVLRMGSKVIVTTDVHSAYLYFKSEFLKESRKGLERTGLEI